MRLPPDGAVGGWAALRLWGGGFFDGTLDGHRELPIDLVIPAGSDIRRTSGIKKHRVTLGHEDVVHRFGIPCTQAARSLVDALDWEESTVRRQQVADLALSAQLTSATEVCGYLAARTNPRNRSVIARTLAQASDRVLSPQETTLRLLWQEAGLPQLRCNWPVADQHGRFIGRPDLLCDAEAVVVEYDGHDHLKDDVRVVNMTKEDAYRRCGLEYIRVIGRDLAYPGRIKARMHQAVLRSRASSIPRTYRLARQPAPVLTERDIRTNSRRRNLS